jgi:hypothetical protein
MINNSARLKENLLGKFTRFHVDNVIIKSQKEIKKQFYEIDDHIPEVLKSMQQLQKN